MSRLQSLFKNRFFSSADTITRRSFVDKVRIQVEGGKGGKGVVSFETSTSGDGWSKKPAGGTGGRGGDIIIRASSSQQDLHMDTFVIRGRPGGDASGSKGSMGRDGKVKTIVVPVGTIVREVHRRYVVNGADLEIDGGDDELLAYDKRHIGDMQKEEINAPTNTSSIANKDSLSSDELTVNSDVNDEQGRGRRRRLGGRVRGGIVKSTVSQSHISENEDYLGSSIVSIPPPLEIDKLRSMRRQSVLQSLQPGQGDNILNSNTTAPTTFSSSTTSNTHQDNNNESIELVRTNKNGLTFKEKTEFIIDLDSPGQTILVASGGAAGVGNKGSLLTYSEQRQDELRPHITGGKGEVRFLELELKIIADVGLVGFPNAGKSSFLASVSKARPKIAEYPFTTLHPHVGVCHFKDSFSLTVADIPGLIEGAHLDRGLGHEFLRHIERTKCLAYVIDVSGANKDPIGDLKALVNELMLYDPLLAAKPALVIANKMDAKGALEGVKKLRSASVLPVIEVSAKEKIGVGQAVDALRFVLEARQREEDKILKATLEAKEQELESILTHKKLTHKKSQIDT